jgi:hypothetical protein
MPNTQERDEVVFKEPILKQSDVKARITFAEPADWKPKAATVEAAREDGTQIEASYKAAKVTVVLTDIDSVRTENEDAIPKSIIETQLNVVRYPHVNKKEGGIAWMGRQMLFDIETAFGFEPVFVDAEGNEVEPHITKSGNKVAPKIKGVARVMNPEFKRAYFHEDMTVNPTNWIDKDVLIDVDVEKSEQFGNKNVIKRFKKLSAV